MMSTFNIVFRDSLGVKYKELTLVSNWNTGTVREDRQSGL